MQHHDASAILDEVAEVLPAGLVEIASEIVHDHNIILSSQVAMKDHFRSRHRQPRQVAHAGESVERGFVFMASRDQDRLHPVGSRPRRVAFCRRRHRSGGSPLRRPDEDSHEPRFLHRSQIVPQRGREDASLARMRDQESRLTCARCQNFRSGCGFQSRVT